MESFDCKYNEVSVPLSGLASVNELTKPLYDLMNLINVSVPLSGLASVNKLAVYDSIIDSIEFPSPYRG